AALQVPCPYSAIDRCGIDAAVGDRRCLARTKATLTLADLHGPQPLHLRRRRECDKLGRFGNRALLLGGEPPLDRAAASQRDHAGEDEDEFRRRVDAGGDAHRQLPVPVAGTSPPTSESLSSTRLRCGEPTSVSASARR